MDEYLKISISELNEVLTPTAPKKGAGTQKTTFVLKRRVSTGEFVVSIHLIVSKMAKTIYYFVR